MRSGAGKRAPRPYAGVESEIFEASSKRTAVFDSAVAPSPPDGFAAPRGADPTAGSEGDYNFFKITGEMK